MKRIGITGGIGSGKSFVSRIIEKHGLDVYDCDSAAKRLMRTDVTLQQRLSGLVGVELFPEGVLDKTRLTKFLLESEENKKAVNAIVHPAVFEDYLASGITFVESAILFESGMNEIVDQVICVSAPLEVRIKRVMLRDGISKEKACDWINNQMEQEEKERMSDLVIVNDGVADVESQIEKLLVINNYK